MLLDSDFDFKVVVGDTTFLNEDNPYGEFKLHRYTTIEDHTNILNEVEKPSRDEIIELRDCDFGKPKDKNSNWNLKNTYYCPVWKNTDFLYGNLYTPKTSWFRLAMHECDSEKRAKVGKTCKSKEEIQDYFFRTILALEVLSVKPDLTTYEKTPITRYFQDVTYSSKPIKDLVEASEIYLKESKIELEDDILGIIDVPVDHYILEWVQGITIFKESKIDPLNKVHTPLIKYWNFMLSREQNAYFRVRYNMMTIIGEVGGVMGLVTTVFAFILTPCTF